MQYYFNCNIIFLSRYISREIWSTPRIKINNIKLIELRESLSDEDKSFRNSLSLYLCQYYFGKVAFHLSTIAKHPSRLLLNAFKRIAFLKNLLITSYARKHYWKNCYWNIFRPSTILRRSNIIAYYVNKSRETSEHKLYIVITCIRILEVSLCSKCCVDQR